MAARSEGRLSGVEAQVPRFVEKADRKNYAARITKFDGYMQFPRPVSVPYQNSMDFTQQAMTR